MARRDQEFQAIRSEGGLLPTDLLRRVLDPRASLVGTRPEDYGLPPAERLTESITQSWNRLRKHWAEFRAAAANLAEGEAGTGFTNDKWSLPLLRELDFGLLPTSAGPEVSGLAYAISRFFGPVPVHLVGCGLSLDRRAAGQRGAAAANPHGLVQEFLNRSAGHLWAIVGNGLRLRVLRDNQALSRQSFLEFDLEAMFRGEIYSDFVLLWLMVHATRFAPREGDRPESCWLEQWTKEAEKQGTRALEGLRGGVEKALLILGEGFTSHPKNAALRDLLRTGQLPLADFHGQLQRVVYRLIFLFVAEDRTLDGQPLLHPRDDSDAARTARERFASHYGTGRLRELAGKIKGSRHGDLLRQFQLVVGALAGDAISAAVRQHLALPALGSFLWSPAATAALNGAELTNHDLLEAIRHLAFTCQGKVLRPVDYRNLGAEELGGVYESLLALTPQISADGARFTFAEFAGNKRKTSGSYYTPDSLVQCLLDSALDPVVEEAIKGKTGIEAEQAILALKVCDPGVGSGHFLVGAAHRLARHLARVRALAQGESEPSPLLYQHALRDVIGRCLYGVDVNPMAAELCRVSLWLEALEPGKPLSFLDHHIRVGNSLLGATPELIAAGLPDDAFTAIEGDDKKVCAVLKKRNKQEREGQQDVFHLMVAEPDAEYNSIAARQRDIDEAPDDTLDAITRKAEQFHRLVVSPEYRHAQQVADTWCAAFVWHKQASAVMEPVTTDTIRRLEGDSRALTPPQQTEVERLSRQYQFFHWHLAFPEVFSKGGFDCVLGNPPWEKISLSDEEFFTSRNPTIANATTKAARKKLIDALALSDPEGLSQYKAAQRFHDSLSCFFRFSNRYPFSGISRVNLYSIFAELDTDIVGPNGRVGIVIASGVVTDDNNQNLFRYLIQSNRLLEVRDFENRDQLFPDVDSRYRFCLLCLGGVHATCAQPQFAFYLHAPEQIADNSVTFELSPDDLARINPITGTCPIFRSARDAALALHVYRLISAVCLQAVAPQWPGTPLTSFNVSNDSPLFVDTTDLEEIVNTPCGMRGVYRGQELMPLYEAKHMWHFDHRWASHSGDGISDVDVIDKANPSRFVVGRFWLRQPDIAARFGAWNKRWQVGYRRVSAPTNERTAIATILPDAAVSYTITLIRDIDAVGAALLVACVCSFVYDYLARQKVSGADLTISVFRQLPVPTQQQLASVSDFILSRALELAYTAWDLEPFAQDCGWSGPPFRWDEERRFLLRCELDAAFFHLYLPAETNGDWHRAEGETTEDLARLKASFPTPRDSVAYIMDTFLIVRRKDEQKFDGDYRTKRIILEIYDAMQGSVRTGQPYQTRLDPPPGPPAVSLPDWQPGHPRPYNWPPNIHPPRGHA